MEYEEAVSKVTLQQVIRDLEPSTSYTFYVKAYTSHGASKPSDAIAESTLGEGESGPRLAFTQTICRVKDYEDDGITYSHWRAMLLSTSCCRISFPCCVAVPAPPSVFTKVLNSSVVQVTWEASSKMGQHQGFKLYYRRAQAPLFSDPFTFARNITQWNITQLGETLRWMVVLDVDLGTLKFKLYYFMKINSCYKGAKIWLFAKLIEDLNSLLFAHLGSTFESFLSS